MTSKLLVCVTVTALAVCVHVDLCFCMLVCRCGSLNELQADLLGSEYLW